jgi:hypothetical protein
LNPPFAAAGGLHLPAHDAIQAVRGADVLANGVLQYTRAMRVCRFLMVVLLALTAQTWLANAQGIDASETTPTEYLVVGTVVWAHAGSSSIAIRGSGLLGYLRIRERAYRVKQASALLDLRPGDAVTAVFSRRDGMLHRLRHVRTVDK